MNAHTPIKLEPALEELNTRLHASFVRILGDCPIENRLRIFQHMTRVAVDELATRKQQIVSNLYDVADALGVTSTVGDTAVREVLRIEFKRKELPDDEQRTRPTDY
jgi:hypothetical protein